MFGKKKDPMEVEEAIEYLRKMQIMKETINCLKKFEGLKKKEL